MPPDYSGQNLRGRSFKGLNLEGANFSYADIKGVDFRNTNLKNANFSNATAGLTLDGLIVLLMTSLLFSGLSGLFLPYFAIKINQDAYKLYILTLLALGCLFTFWFIRLGLFSALVVSVISAALSGMNVLATSMTSILVLTLAITIAKSIGKKAVNAALVLSAIASFVPILYWKHNLQLEEFVAVLITNAASIVLSFLYEPQNCNRG